MRALMMAGLLLLGGCTYEDGRGWATLSSRLWTSFYGFDSGSGRLGADGWFKTNNSFELKIASLELGLRELRAQTLFVSASGSGDCTFDPQNPPAGCSLCHGGHCHCDGKLKSYEELKQEVCGGGGAVTSAATVVRMPVKELQSLMGSGTQTNDLPCVPGCELDAGQLDQLQAVLDRLTLRGRLRDLSLEDRLNGQQLTVTVDLNLAGGALGAALTPAQKMDQDNPQTLALAVKLPVTEKLLDSILWHRLQRVVNSVTIDSSSNITAGQTIATNLAQTTLAVTAEREEQ